MERDMLKPLFAQVSERTFAKLVIVGLLVLMFSMGIFLA